MSKSKKEITIKFGNAKHNYKVISEPVPHILVKSKKTLHGWWKGKRECTAERMLINPYNGCTYDCFCCYTKGTDWPYFKLWNREKIITVFEDFVAEYEFKLELQGKDNIVNKYLKTFQDLEYIMLEADYKKRRF